MHTPTLITIAPSHYCEKARWALQRAGLPFTESAWLPLMHVYGVKRHGGRRSTPVLVLEDRTLFDSTDILAWIDAHPDSRWRPYAAGDAARRLEDDFDERLGPHTRRLAYFHLLPDRAGVLEAADHWVGPCRQRRVFGALFGPIRWAMRRSMKIDAAGAERSRAKIDAVFADVEGLLADGRRYLAGDAFGAADLTFAALAAPMVKPDAYGAWLPPMERAPVGFQEEAARYRATVAGRFALRLYDEARA